MILTADNSAHESKAQREIGAMEGYAFFSSLAFHFVLILLTVVGLPFVVKDEVLVSEPIQVELVTIAEKTQAPVKPPPAKAEQKEPPKEEPKPEPKKAPPVERQVEPDAVPPPVPEVKKEIEKPPEPKAVEPPPVKPKIKPKVKPKPQVVEEKKPDEPDQSDAFSSLLKDLTPEEEEAPVQNETQQSETESRNLAPLGEQLTISEIDAFKQQIAPCWVVQSGAKYAENLLVEIKIYIGKDQRVQSATLVDQVRYSLDSHYRAAADAALRALRNPACQPFNLPGEKYEQWREMTIRFDPREML